MFKNDSCVIQERGTVRKIGLTNQLDGLYYLKLSQVKLSTNVHGIDIDHGRLWHLRLGHLSHDRTKCLNKKYNYIPIIALESYDVCHMEKQKKFPFL